MNLNCRNENDVRIHCLHTKPDYSTEVFENYVNLKGEKNNNITDKILKNCSEWAQATQKFLTTDLNQLICTKGYWSIRYKPQNKKELRLLALHVFDDSFDLRTKLISNKSYYYDINDKENIIFM